MTNRDKREMYRKKYKGKYKEKIRQALKRGYIEMGEINLELAEEGVGIED